MREASRASGLRPTGRINEKGLNGGLYFIKLWGSLDQDLDRRKRNEQKQGLLGQRYKSVV